MGKKSTKTLPKPTTQKPKLQVVKPLAGGKTAKAAAPKTTASKVTAVKTTPSKSDKRNKLSDADVQALRAEFRKGRTDFSGKLIPGARGKDLITLGALAKKWKISTRYASTLVHGQARAKAA